MNSLLAKVYAEYGMTRTEFAKYSNIPYKTLEGWEMKGCSSLGTILLNKFLEIKELEAKHQKDLKDFAQKAERYNLIQEVLAAPSHSQEPRLLDVVSEIRNVFGAIDFSLHVKGKESFDSAVRNAILEMVEAKEIVNKKQIKEAVLCVKENFEEIIDKFDKGRIVSHNWEIIKNYIRKGL